MPDEMALPSKTLPLQHVSHFSFAWAWVMTSRFRSVFIAFGLFFAMALPASAQPNNEAKQRIAELERKVEQLQNSLKTATTERKNADKRVIQLDQDLQERDKRIVALEAAVKKAKATGDEIRAFKSLENQVKERDQKIQQIKGSFDALMNERKNELAVVNGLRKDVEKLSRDVRDLEAIEKGNCVHAAFYRIKKDMNPKEVDHFLVAAPRVIGKLPGVRGLWVGKPNIRGTEAPEYDVGVVAIFDDPDALRRFLDHPVYRQFDTSTRRTLEPTPFNLLRE